MLTLLARLFVPERHRPRAGTVGHSIPLASEVDVHEEALDPVMVTSTRGGFLVSRVASGGYVRFGFSDCGLDQEKVLLATFVQELVLKSHQNQWGCVVDTVEDAVDRMIEKGEAPVHLVTGPWLTRREGLVVLDADLPEGQALLVTSPARAGIYTRIGDYVGVAAYKVDRRFIAIGPR